MIDEEKYAASREQAVIIRTIVNLSAGLDVEFLRRSIADIRAQALALEGAAMFLPTVSATHVALRRVQAATLEHLCDFIDGNREVDLHKRAITNEEEAMQEHLRRFGL